MLRKSPRKCSYTECLRGYNFSVVGGEDQVVHIWRPVRCGCGVGFYCSETCLDSDKPEHNNRCRIHLEQVIPACPMEEFDLSQDTKLMPAGYRVKCEDIGNKMLALAYEYARIGEEKKAIATGYEAVSILLASTGDRQRNTNLHSSLQTRVGRLQVLLNTFKTHSNSFILTFCWYCFAGDKFLQRHTLQAVL
jgi:hypothetical protein